jgi:V/A-type H+-transporting ATPase subunit D
MTLIRLRRRLELSRRGHKLLKNKQEKLMQNFFGVIEETTRLRREVGKRFLDISLKYLKGRYFTDAQALSDALNLSGREASLEITERNEMGIRIPEYKVSFPEAAPVYKLSSSSASLDAAFSDLYESFQTLLDLAARETALFRMSQELEKTRRRVNALEYVLIPDLESSITRIERKLTEYERANQTRLMKIKDMLEG